MGNGSRSTAKGAAERQVTKKRSPPNGVPSLTFGDCLYLLADRVCGVGLGQSAPIFRSGESAGVERPSIQPLRHLEGVCIDCPDGQGISGWNRGAGGRVVLAVELRLADRIQVGDL